MKSHSVVFFFLFLFISSFSQTPMAGIINQYSKVEAIDRCQGLLTTGNTAGFVVGEQVLLIQMKGAQINESNSTEFGNIEDSGSSGLFEKNEIAAISGNEITLKYLLRNDYDVNGAVQLISFPVFENAVVTETVLAAPWDGEKGGVVALEVAADLTLEANITADGAGFRGAATNTVASDCNFLTNANNYFYNLTNWRGAPKGEGLAAILPGKEQGRGAQANGGGGGNDHNAGGGGGANISAAGQGGETSSPGFNCDGAFPGVGGKALPDESVRWYLGGGGGAGHDNNGSGSGGGNGGGLIIVLANRITSNGFVLAANGNPATMAVGDGAGGGGAGGTVVVVATELTDPLKIQAFGGDGGDVQNPADRCNGPGGGGSGGRLVTNLSSQVDFAAAGGLPGENQTPSGQCSDPASGATAGEAGQQMPFDSLPTAFEEILPFAVGSQPEPLAVCESETATFGFSVSGNALTYQWQCNDGSGWQDILPGSDYAGESTPQLELLTTSLLQNGFLYRCLVAGPCLPDTLSAVASLSVEAAPEALFLVNQLGNGQISWMNNSTNATSFIWDFGDGTVSNDPNPNHQYQNDGTYEVSLTASNACGESTTSQTIIVGGLPVASFQANYSGCAPVTVQFQDLSEGPNIQSYFWEFPGGDPAVSMLQNPSVTYDQPGSYDVSLTVTNTSGEHTTTRLAYVDILPVPIAAFDFMVDSNTVFFTNNSTGAIFYNWNFGDGVTSDELDPTHTYTQGGVFTVTLAASNPACGSVVSEQIFIDVTNVGEETVPAWVRVFPNPFSGQVHLTLTVPPGQPVEVGLFDLHGHFLHKKTVQGQASILETTDLPAGIYVLRVQMQEQLAHFKMVKTE